MELLFKNKIARIISTIFVPPSLTLIIFTFFAFHFENDSVKITETILISLILGFISPISIYFILKRKGKIIDVDASIKEERTLPYIVATFFYLLGLAMMIKIGLNIVIIAFWFCYISNTLITIIINKHWKISAHAMGITGPITAMYFAMGLNSILFIPLIILVGWSRIELKCHTFFQVAAGILLAFVSTFSQMYFIIHYFNTYNL